MRLPPRPPRLPFVVAVMMIGWTASSVAARAAGLRQISGTCLSSTAQCLAVARGGGAKPLVFDVPELEFMLLTRNDKEKPVVFLLLLDHFLQPESLKLLAPYVLNTFLLHNKGMNLTRALLNSVILYVTNLAERKCIFAFSFSISLLFFHRFSSAAS